MKLSLLFGAWNPNKYHTLKEVSLRKIALTLLLTTVASVIVCFVLLLPSFFKIEQTAQDLRTTTNITFDASMTQTSPAYLSRNPDIVITTGAQEGFLTITPDKFILKKFLYFGREEYEWKQFATVETMPLQAMLSRAIIFLLPSIIFWLAFGILCISLFLSLLYTLLAHFIMHTRKFEIAYKDLWKISLYACIPSTIVFGVLPILRLGLPLGVIFGFQFVLYIGFSVLGTALIAERHAPKQGQSSAKAKN